MNYETKKNDNKVNVGNIIVNTLGNTNTLVKPNNIQLNKSNEEKIQKKKDEIINNFYFNDFW
jgi:hypothetical protein